MLSNQNSNQISNQISSNARTNGRGSKTSPVNKLDESGIAAAFRAYQQGASLQEIADSLNEMGYTSPRGSVIYPTEVRKKILLAGAVTRPRRREPTMEDIVIRMVRAGATQIEIGKVINRSQPGVSVIVRHLRAEGRL